MRAIDIKNGQGPIEALYMNHDVPKPQAGPSQALVKVKAFGLNRMDLLQREGKYNVPPQAGKILGVEFSGTIEALGPEETGDFKEGDEVFGLAYGGAYAEFITVSVHMLIHKPQELAWVQAAGIPETWMTATQALYLVGCFKPGNNVLWHAGASAVSIAGVQLAKAGGAKNVYVTAGSTGKVDFCVHELGASAGFNYLEGDWSQDILKATDGEGVNVLIDFIGQDYFQKNLDVAAIDGRIVLLASLSGTVLNGVNFGAIEKKRLRLEGSRLRSRELSYQRKLRDTLVEHALPKLRDGTLKVFIDRVFPWNQIQDAHTLMESNQTKGKIICTIE